ncbi:DNA gyrase inhibitor YacG [Roseibaca ekhonensis]|uniref:DNA gyrase inhibitor YacG n=1 Tax=Roseinatronobacter ekhonensis TaxID=254356 RepID=A0A3B0MAB0_9RHOB|nr:DNA gyrase inhibitor YacG [Roseibaca ekhonensis]SUZ32865.1 DNA gyrase inhibitor YacG [Roseibaca ekhonensis]
MSCPICRKATVADYRPFCSRRCADVDLARWLRADYAIPVPLTDAEDDPSDADDNHPPETR